MKAKLSTCPARITPQAHPPTALGSNRGGRRGRIGAKIEGNVGGVVKELRVVVRPTVKLPLLRFTFHPPFPPFSVTIDSGTGTTLIGTRLNGLARGIARVLASVRVALLPSGGTSPLGMALECRFATANGETLSATAELRMCPGSAGTVPLVKV